MYNRIYLNPGSACQGFQLDELQTGFDQLVWWAGCLHSCVIVCVCVCDCVYCLSVFFIGEGGLQTRPLEASREVFDVEMSSPGGI